MRTQRALVCCICQKVADHPKVMKCCGSIACASCYDDWVRRSEMCPHCGRSVRKGHHSNGSSKKSSDEVICSVHHKPCDYICKTCDEYICGDCIFEQLNSPTSAHSGHEIAKVSEFDTPYSELRDELKQLKSALGSIDAAMAASEAQQGALNEHAEEVTILIYTVYSKVKDQFEKAVYEARQPYAIAIDELEKQALTIADLADEAEKILNSDDCRDAAYAQAFLERLKAQVEAMTVKEIPIPSGVPDNGLLPRMKFVTFEIPNFPAKVQKFRRMRDEDTRFIYSNHMKFFGGIWRAKIYPNGNGNGLHTHVSIFFELLEARTPVAPYVYRIVIKAREGRDIVREFVSPFKQMDSWGWCKAAPHDLVLTDSYLFGESRTLKIEIGLRPESYRVMYDIGKSAYESLTRKYNALKESRKREEESHA